jgi:hypothetical protein
LTTKRELTKFVNKLMGPDAIQLLIGNSSPGQVHTVWAYFSAKWDKTGTLTVMQQYTQLWDTRISVATVDEFVSALNKSFSGLVQAKETISDPFRVAAVLHQLRTFPDNTPWRRFTTSVLTSGVQPNFKTLVAQMEAFAQLNEGTDMLRPPPQPKWSHVIPKRREIRVTSLDDMKMAPPAPEVIRHPGTISGDTALFTKQESNRYCPNCETKAGHRVYKCPKKCNYPSCQNTDGHVRNACPKAERDFKNKFHSYTGSSKASNRFAVFSVPDTSTDYCDSVLVSDCGPASSPDSATGPAPDSLNPILTVLDSGASAHFFHLHDQNVQFILQARKLRHNTANGEGALTTDREATVRVQLPGAGGPGDITGPTLLKTGTVSDSLPGVSLLSVAALDREGYHLDFGGGQCRITNPVGEHVSTVPLTDEGLYGFRTRNAPRTRPGPATEMKNALTPALNGPDLETCMFAQPKGTPTVSKAVLHMRWGHLGSKKIDHLVKAGLFKTTGKLDYADCDSCHLSKSRRQPHRKGARFVRAKKPGEYFHFDLVSYRIGDLKGRRYALICVDDYSRWTRVYMLGKKSDQLEAIKGLFRYSKTQTGNKVKWARNDGEWDSADWHLLKKRYGIRQMKTQADTPQSNGVSERFNGTIGQMARSILIASALPPSFIGLALETASYTWNRTPRSNSELRTPFDLFHHRPPMVAQIRVFGCLAYPHIQDHDKAQGRSHEGVLVGYNEERGGYRVYVPSENTIVDSRDCTFNEKKRGWLVLHESLTGSHYFTPFRSAGVCGKDVSDKDDPAVHTTTVRQAPGQSVSPSSSSSSSSIARPVPDGAAPLSPSFSSLSARPVHDIDGAASISPPLAPTAPSIVPMDAALPVQRRSRRVARPSEKFIDSILYAKSGSGNTRPTNLSVVAHSDPRRVADWWDPTHCPDPDNPDEWHEAKVQEMEKMRKLGTYSIVSRPRHKKVLGARWVLTKKLTGARKARYVGKGFSQMPGRDFTVGRTAAPTLKTQSFRTIVADAALDGSDIDSVDVTAAFLNAELKEEIYIEMPPELRTAGRDEVWLLHKAIYGLKQAGFEWNADLHETLTSGGYTNLKSDPCVYIRTEMDGSTTKIGVHVDDFIVKTRVPAHLDHLRKTLEGRYAITVQSPASVLLGMHIVRSPDGYALHQTPFLDETLQKYGFQDARPTAVPAIPIGDELAQTKSGKLTSLGKFSLQAIVGSLLWLARMTRPDIAYAVARLAQRVADPSPVAYAMAGRILRYLKGSRGRGLFYRKTGNTQLVGYVDSDFAMDPDDRKSHSSWLYMLAGAPVSWRSVKQSNTLALSSTEAELVAAVDAAREAAWFISLFTEMGTALTLPLQIYEDNQAAIYLARLGLSGRRTKHMDLRYHFIHALTKDGRIRLDKVDTKDNLADVGTKPLTQHLFHRLTDAYMTTVVRD